jgi:hypothetical protein
VEVNEVDAVLEVDDWARRRAQQTIVREGVS